MKMILMAAVVLAAVSCTKTESKKSIPTPKGFNFLGSEVKSNERALVDAGMTKAVNEGKTLTIYIGGQWCTPCNSFKANIKNDPEFKKAIDETTVWIEIEDMVTTMQSFPDYLGKDFTGFPQIQIYNPKTDKWGFLGILTDISLYKDSLMEAFSGTEVDIVAERQKFRDKLAAKVSFEIDPKKIYVELSLLTKLSMDVIQYQTLEEYEEFIEEIRIFKEENPTLLSRSLATIAAEAILFGLETGKISVDDIEGRLNSLAFENVEKKLSHEYRKYVAAAVAKEARSQNLTSIFPVCMDIVKNKFPLAYGQGDDLSKLRVDLMCSSTDWMQNRLSADEKTKLFEQGKIVFEKTDSYSSKLLMAKLALAYGDLKTAAEYYQKHSDLYAKKAQESVDGLYELTDKMKADGTAEGIITFYEGWIQSAISSIKATQDADAFLIERVNAGDTNPAKAWYQKAAN